MTNKASSFPAATAVPLMHRHGGKLSSMMGELSVHAMGDDYTVDGNGVVRSLPTVPIGVSAVLRILNKPTFIHSAKLICPGAIDYVASVGDLLIVRSDGDGIWRLYVLAASNKPTAIAQGRLTLVSGVANPKNDTVGATILYLTPIDGSFAELSNDITQSSVGNAGPAAVVPCSIYDIIVWRDPVTGVKYLTRSPFWTTTATITMTIASPCVVTWSGSDFPDGAPITFTTTGALPTGLIAGTMYFVKRTGANGVPTATFNLAATAGGAAINTSGSQSGTHTAVAASDLGQGTGSGTAERQLVNGVLTNKWPITNGPGANLGQIVGAVRSDVSGQLKDTVAFRWVSNIYNVAPRQMKVFEATSSWNYTTATYRQANASISNQLDVLMVVDGQQLNVNCLATYSNTTTSTYGLVKIDIDAINTTTVTGNLASLNYVQIANGFAACMSQYNGYPGMGRHIAIWTELSSSVGAGTFYGVNLSLQSGLMGTVWN